MEFFLTALAVDEANQWAASDGNIPHELLGTRFGSELLQQAQTLAYFVSCALRTNTPVGAAFMSAIRPEIEYLLTFALAKETAMGCR
jgi:hypothetical protein